MVSSGLGPCFRRGKQELLCQGRLRYTQWRFDVAGGRPALLRAMAMAYAGTASSWQSRDATLAVELPTQDTVRKGDFGEIVGGALFSHRLGEDVPFQKLETMRPTRNATVQGPDVFALGFTGDIADPVPIVVETKVRPQISPKEILDDIATSLGRVDEPYVVSAWRAAVKGMKAHPARTKQFAMSAAEHLAQLTAPEGTYPEHERQAVIVTGRHTLTKEKIEEHWGSNPPVRELHVIQIDDLQAIIDSIFDEVGTWTYGDVASSAPHSLPGHTHKPGLDAPVVSDEAVVALRPADGDASPMLLIEASLWFLADWDGMGTARANTLARNATEAEVEALALLLAGRARQARETTQHVPLLTTFIEAVESAWRLRLDGDGLAAVANDVASQLDDEALVTAVRYVGAAIRHRLPRHPRSMTDDAGATGPVVRAVVRGLAQKWIRALWPSQAAAINGGLLDDGHASMAIKMPTSAGKTKLVELRTAHALDQRSGCTVVVLAPTKALVRQVSTDLRKSLPDDTPVRSSHGGLDFDIEGPGQQGLMTQPGVEVVTPERFDLEWRHAVSNGNHEIIERVGLLVVDEAHLVNDQGRGPRLELVLGRAMRAGIPIVLVSSQLPNVENLAEWIGGVPITCSWTPTWLERYVAFDSDDKKSMYLRREGCDAEVPFSLTTSKTPGPNECRKGRAHQAAALAEQRLDDGLVVIYSHQRRYIDGLVASVDERFSVLGQPVDQRLAAVAEPIETTEPEYARLVRMGVGVHHAGVPRRVRHVVEFAARNNMLRAVVCSPTLLEGVDFPTKTVIAAYPPESKGRVEVAKFHNLVGRAGRGGIYASGVVIVMAPDSKKADAWLKAFRRELPPTRSALSEALRRLLSWGSAKLRGEQEVDADILEVVDTAVLAAIAEGAVVDGDLRRALEAVLGRTYWYFGANAVEREKLLEKAAERAQFVSHRLGGDKWSKLFYRSGLPFASGMALRDAVLPEVSSLYNAVMDPDEDHDGVMLWLAANVAPATTELRHLRDVDPSEIEGALRMWLNGEPEDAISAKYEATWKALTSNGSVLDTLFPWMLTTAIDIINTEAEMPGFRDIAHRRLAPARLRYGVPRTDTCELVRDGFDRDDAIAITAEFDAEVNPLSLMTLLEFGRQKRAERDAALAEGEEPF